MQRRNRDSYIKSKINHIKDNFQYVDLEIDEVELPPFIKREYKEAKYLINDIRHLLHTKICIEILQKNPDYDSQKLATMKLNLDLFEPFFEEYRKYLKSPRDYFISLQNMHEKLMGEIYKIFEATQFINVTDDIETDYITELNTIKEKSNEAIKPIL